MKIRCLASRTVECTDALCLTTRRCEPQIEPFQVAHCNVKFFLSTRAAKEAHESSTDGNYVSTVFNFFSTLPFNSFALLARAFVFRRVSSLHRSLRSAASIVVERLCSRPPQEVCSNCFVLGGLTLSLSDQMSRPDSGVNDTTITSLTDGSSEEV